MPEHLPDLEEYLKRFKDPIVLGDLNVHLDKTRIQWSQQVADFLSENVLIDLVCHFHQRCRFRNLKTWSQFMQEIILRSICNYILGPDQRCFELIGICNMRNLSTDHFALRAWLICCPTLCNARYIIG